MFEVCYGIKYTMNNKLLLIILTVLIIFSSPLVSASQDDFKKGTESFIQGDYAVAVKAFKQAEMQGMKSPALYYNLASSYYKLGEFKKSRDYFNKVRNYKDMRDLADYNLGLIALNQDDKQTAKKLFTNVAKNTDDKKLAALAEKNLREIGSQKPASWVTKKWSGYLSASLGYDDNVNFGPLGISNEVSGSFSELIATGDYLFSGDRKNGWLGEAYFYSIKYLDIDPPNEDLFDEYEFTAGIKKYLQLNPDWQTLYSLNIRKISYSGEDYQTIAKIGAEARNKLSRNERLHLRYSYEDINSDRPLYDYLEGWRQKLRAEYRLYRKRDNSRLYYELELNNREDISPGNPSTSSGFFSYSPTRHTLRGRYTSKLNRAWHLTGDLAYRYSDYPATVDQDRQDDRYKAAVYADYLFTNDVKLRAKLEHMNNRSTEDIFTYRRTMYSLGLNALF